MNKVKIVIGLIAILSIGWLTFENKHLRKEVQIKRNNEASLLDGISYYKTKDSLNVARIGVLELKKKEIEEHIPELKKEIERLNIKLKRVESIGFYPTQIIGRVDSRLKDTIIFANPVKSFTFDDGYLKQSGIITRDSLKSSYTYTDTIIPVIEKIPHRFLFIRYGVKAYRLEIFSKNHKAHIICPKQISVRRK